MFSNIVQGISLVTTIPALSAMAIGTLIGLIVGGLPGLSGTMAIALVLPFTLYVSPWVGIPLILGIYKASTWGGAVSSILINTPGNASAAAIAVEGFELKKRGQGGRAIEASLKSGVIGDVFSDIVTILICQPLAAIALLFSPPEFTLIMVLALMVIAAMQTTSTIKSLLSAVLGIIISTVGLDPIQATPRLVFGFAHILDGFKLIPILIGVFAMSEVLWQIGRRKSIATTTKDLEEDDQPLNRQSRDSFRFSELFSYAGTVIRSAVVGTWIGILPGIGSAVSPWIAYGMAKRRSKKPQEYGKGSIEGLIAAQTACNSVCGANLIPLLTLGIPGDIVAAMLLSTLMVHGLRPGPLIFQSNPIAIYAIFATLLICDVLYYFQGLWVVKLAKKINSLRDELLLPFVSILCILGTYAYNSSFVDVYIMLIFGAMGYVMRSTGMSIPSFIIAFILGPLLETNLRQSLLLSDGRLWIFLGRPLTAGLFVIALASLFFIAKPFFNVKKSSKAKDEKLLEEEN